MPITSRFLDPLTDFGFKRLFGSEPDKDIMIDFLNVLFEGEKVIVEKSLQSSTKGFFKRSLKLRR